MRSGTTPDDGSRKTDGGSTTELIERHLYTALDAAETSETRFHLRQALQLMEALE